MSQQTVQDVRMGEPYMFTSKVLSQKTHQRNNEKFCVSILISFNIIPLPPLHYMIHLPEWCKQQQPVESQFICLFEVPRHWVTKDMLYCHFSLSYLYSWGWKRKQDIGNTGRLVSLMLRLDYGNRASDGIFGRTGFGFPSEGNFHVQKWP